MVDFKLIPHEICQTSERKTPMIRGLHRILGLDSVISRNSILITRPASRPSFHSQKAVNPASFHRHFNNSVSQKSMDESSNIHWATAGPATFDFRSDVVTTPTLRMLSAIQSTTLLDDVYEEDTTTQGLEKLIADLTGKQSSLFVLSGTMGNQVALRTHLGGPPHSVICDYRAHIVCWEAGATSSLSGAFVRDIIPSNGHHLTLEDIQKHASLEDNVHLATTRVISLENTVNGTIIPLPECQRISQWARSHGILMHLDGARLWEAVAAGAGSLKDYCACFDSISLCFSKNLGAPIGSIVAGDTAFIKRARWIRKMLGGGLRQAGVVSAAARVAVEDTFLGGKLVAGHEKARELGQFWEGLGGKLKEAVETNMVWIDLEDTGFDVDTLISKAAENGIKLFGARFVIHYQISDEAVSKLKTVLQELRSSQPESK
jgi:threonine aldolase